MIEECAGYYTRARALRQLNLDDSEEIRLSSCTICLAGLITKADDRNSFGTHYEREGAIGM